MNPKNENVLQSKMFQGAWNIDIISGELHGAWKKVHMENVLSSSNMSNYAQSLLMLRFAWLATDSAS